MENSMDSQTWNQHVDEFVKLEPKVVILYEAWNYDNRTYGIIKAKGYTALTAEVHKENLKHNLLDSKIKE